MTATLPTYLLALVLLSSPEFVSADEPVAAPTYYAVNVYGVPGGEGRALVIGPIRRENCARTKPVFAEAADNLPVPPEMSLQISDCLMKPALSRALYAPFHCISIDSQKLPRSPGVHIWVYYCHWQ